MRKKLWACAVAAAVFAVSGGIAVDYAWNHPQSWLGRGLFGASQVAGFPLEPMRFANKAAELTYYGVRGVVSHGRVASHHETTTAVRCDEGCPMQPALLPGIVVMQDDREGLPAQAMPPVRDAVGVRGGWGGVEMSEEARMPAVMDDSPVMPRVETDAWPTIKKSSKGEVMPGCREDEEFHPETYIPPSKGQAAIDEAQQLFKKIECNGEKAKHRDIDTMEMRPSDLRIIEFNGPF